MNIGQIFKKLGMTLEAEKKVGEYEEGSGSGDRSGISGDSENTVPVTISRNPFVNNSPAQARVTFAGTTFKPKAACNCNGKR